MRAAPAMPTRPVLSRISVAGSGTAVMPGAVILPAPVSVNGAVGGTVGRAGRLKPLAVSAPVAMLKMPVPPVIVKFLVIAALPSGSGTEFKPVNVPAKEFPLPKSNAYVPLSERVPSGFSTEVPLDENWAAPKGVKTAVPTAPNSPAPGRVLSPFGIENERMTVSARATAAEPRHRTVNVSDARKTLRKRG